MSTAERPADAGPPDELDPDRELPRVLAVLGVILFMLVAMLAALLTVMFVPTRVGTVVVPVSVLFAAVTNVVLPTMSRRLIDTLIGGIAPVAAWLIIVFLLAQGRPEGDVLLPGAGTLAYVAYAVMGAGALAGGVTVFRAESVRSARALAPGSTIAKR